MPGIGKERMVGGLTDSSNPLRAGAPPWKNRKSPSTLQASPRHKDGLGMKRALGSHDR